jgi:hypothetical protein
MRLDAAATSPLRAAENSLRLLRVRENPVASGAACSGAGSGRTFSSPSSSSRLSIIPSRPASVTGDRLKVAIASSFNN